MRISALSRGGYSVQGGSYDPHTNEVVVETRDGETIATTIEYPSTPSSMSKAEHGITATSPTISGNVASLTLSAIQDSGYVDVTATVGGAIRIIRIRGRSQTEVDRYDC